MSDIESYSDEEIVEKVRVEDRELYAVLLERYQHKLLRYVVHMLKDEHKAVDVVQETFIKAFLNLQGFDTNKKFSSWIYRIAHNETMNTIKKYRLEIPLLDTVDFPSTENSEADFEQKELSALVEQCFRDMPILYSEPLILSAIDGKSYEEVSDILRIPMGTVAIRINRGKALMKHLCQKN